MCLRVRIDKEVPHHDILLHSSQTMFSTARVYISTDYQFMSVLVSGAVHSSSVVCPADYNHTVITLDKFHPVFPFLWTVWLLHSSQEWEHRVKFSSLLTGFPFIHLSCNLSSNTFLNEYWILANVSKLLSCKVSLTVVRIDSVMVISHS